MENFFLCFPFCWGGKCKIKSVWNSFGNTKENWTFCLVVFAPPFFLIEISFLESEKRNNKKFLGGQFLGKKIPSLKFLIFSPISLLPRVLHLTNPHPKKKENWVLIFPNNNMGLMKNFGCLLVSPPPMLGKKKKHSLLKKMRFFFFFITKQWS